MGSENFKLGQSFSSDNRKVEKLLEKAEKIAKSNTDDLENVTTHIIEAMSIDRKIQQNLLSRIEKISESKNFQVAECYANASIRAIGRYDKDESLYFGLSLPKNVYSNDVYRILIQICSKKGYFRAYKNLIKCLQNDDYQQKILLEEVSQDIGNKSSEIFNILTQKHLSNSNDQSEVKKRKERVKGPITLPLICIRHRSLLKSLVARDLRMKYHKSILGWIWGLMEPLALTLTFLLIYEIMASEPSKFRALSIMIGILFWAFFATALKKGTVFLESNVRLIQKVSLPKEIFLLSGTGFAMATLAINALALIPFMIYYQISPSFKLLIIPVVVIIIATLAVGISMFTSILHSKLRDTGQVVNVVTRVGFYFTPVFYTVDMIADSRIPAEYFSTYLVVNPMAVFIAIIRSSILGTDLTISSIHIGIAILETAIIFILGSYYYQSKQDQAVKYL